MSSTKNDEGNSDITDSTTTLSEDVLPTLIHCKSPILEPNAPPCFHSGAATISAQLQSTPLTSQSVAHVLSAPTTSHETETFSAPSIQIVTPVRTGSLRRRQKSSDRSIANQNNPYEAYDDRVIPAQRNLPCESSILTKDSHTTVLKLNEKEKRQAAQSIAIYGANLVEKFYSRQFSDKEEGLRILESILKNPSQLINIEDIKLCNRLARSTILLLHRALRDKVFSVYSLAGALVEYFFENFINDYKISTNEIIRSNETILPELLTRSGESTPRVHNKAVHTILKMAHCQELRKLNVIPQYLTKTGLTSSTNPRLAQSKLEIVEQLILSLGISTDKQSGMTCRILAEFGTSGLHHPAEPVRKVAERVLILVYKTNPRIVRKQLPRDDEITRRNVLYRHLMQEFDKIDSERKDTDLPLLDTCSRRSMIRSGSQMIPNKDNSKQLFQKQTMSTLRNSVSTYDNSCSKPEKIEKSKENQCPFCYKICPNFSKEEPLNIHFWKFCPILTRCLNCQEVVEIANLNMHCLENCEFKDSYYKCERCEAAVLKTEYSTHNLNCLEYLHCPFCKTAIIENTELFWRQHLTDFKTCFQHPRAKILEQGGSSGYDDSSY